MTETFATNIVPSNPTDRKKIKDIVIEASGLKQRQKDMGAQVKDCVELINSDFPGISKKAARQLINVYHKQNYSEVTRDSAEFELAYETIIGSPSA